MDEPQSINPPLALPGTTWSDLRWLLVLFALIGALRAWQIYNTEITSRDSIAYIRYAWRLEHEPWGEVIRREIHHPGYGFLIYFISQPVRALSDADLPLTMQYSAQIASAFASLLLLLPMFYLGKELFDSRVAFWACLLFQVLPSPGRLMPDGLSEPLFLVWVISALLFTARGLRTQSFLWFLPAGLCTGLAYLTRTEGLLVLPAAVTILAARQCFRGTRLPWPRFLGNGAAIVTACLLIVAPFMLHIGALSLKSSYRHITNPDGWQQPAPSSVSRASLNTPQPLALWWIGADVKPSDRIGWATWALGVTLYEAHFHIVGPLTLAGLWLFRRRFLEVPGAAVMLLCGIILLLLLWRLAQSAGYIGERHVLLIVLGGVFFAVATVAYLGHRLAAGRHPWFSLAILLVLLAFCLPKTAKRLHGNRAGFREAGRWIADNSKPGDEVFDPLAWTSYHAGRLFVPRNAVRSRPEVCYVVLERSENTHPHLFYLIEIADALIKQGGEIVYRQPVRKAEILVYRVPRPAPNSPTGAQLNVWLAASHNR